MRIYDALTQRLLMLSLGVTTVQVIMGAQVRQFVDKQTKLLGMDTKNMWLQDPDILFYLHRSFSIMVVALNLYIAYRIFKLGLGYAKIKWVMVLIFLEIITGMLMYYIYFPFGSQPIHLLLASLLFGVQFYLILESRKQITTATP